MAVATASRIGETNTWAASVPLPSINGEDKENRSSMALHFVIDNSGSMGSMTNTVKQVFSSLVDSAASKPCSLTLFENKATLMSADISSSKHMLDLPGLPQGGTNIPVGIQSAMEVIALREKQEEARGVRDKTHHILILLTDGCHNRGPAPTTEFPRIGKQCKTTIPGVQLSVVVVGITRNSSTTMGMLLKTSLETVPLDANTIENIYYAVTRNDVQTVAAKLVEGLDCISTGTVYTVSHPNGNLVPEIGGEKTSAYTFRATRSDSNVTIFLEDKHLPGFLVVNGSRIEMVQAKETNHEIVADALAQHISRIKIKRVASGKPSIISSAIRQISVLVDALERELASVDKTKLTLTKARGYDRLSQYRTISKTVHMAKELRNQLAEVGNFSANSSEEQAAFLTGRKSKYASKALRRAAARSSDDLVVVPKTELAKVHSELTSKSFIEAVTLDLRVDVMSHLVRLSQRQLQTLMGQVEQVSKSDHDKLRRIIASGAFARFAGSESANTNALSNNDVLFDLDPATKDFIDSGYLAWHLNKAFFGSRQSYFSLSGPWEHISEWRDLTGDQVAFRTQWEMLLYIGLVAYPIRIERSASTQMNPFQLAVTQVRTTIVDTASLCCANHSEIDTYGPEGGEPIKDALVLVDPSHPRASTRIVSTKLLGETFISVTVSRDLHMYTGASMKIALLANSLFSCLQPEPTCMARPEAVAEIRREFLGRAYQCGSCGFGPVDHGGCSDLFSHHGEVDYGGGVASNSCPSCGWFSGNIGDWQPWDGTVPDTLVEERTSRQNRNNAKPLQAKMDVVLRILYSFRKQFSGRNNPVMRQYHDLARKLVSWDMTITTQDGVDALVQILIAVMACDDEVIGDKKAILAAFDPPVVLAIVNEACARVARKKFRIASGGNESKSKKLAADYVTNMLGVTRESAPTTTESLLEPEPDSSVVFENCCRDYSFDWSSQDENDKHEIAWARKIATRWCRVFTMARALRVYLVDRPGGWDQLELDMETSLENYIDVVEALQNAEPPDSSFLFDMCDIAPETANRTLATMAAQAFLNNRGATRHNLDDVRCGETLRNIARDMRMRIYQQRVQEKMATWVNEGQQLTFCKARAADIGQYYDMIGGGHVHGLSKELFWGLWEAAMNDGHGGEKVLAFLETANEEFRYKHAPSSGELVGKTRKKRV